MSLCHLDIWFSFCGWGRGSRSGLSFRLMQHSDSQLARCCFIFLTRCIMMSGGKVSEPEPPVASSEGESWLLHQELHALVATQASPSSACGEDGFDGVAYAHRRRQLARPLARLGGQWLQSLQRPGVGSGAHDPCAVRIRISLRTQCASRRE